MLPVIKPPDRESSPRPLGGVPRWSVWQAAFGLFLLGVVAIVWLAQGADFTSLSPLALAPILGLALYPLLIRRIAESAEAGGTYAGRALRASRKWSADEFEINRRDYDPEGDAWAEFVSAASAHGYELVPDDGAADRPWRFVRKHT
jgi:hypothetical protein